jgi:fructokinase
VPKTQQRHVLVVGESLVDVLATPTAPPVDAPGGSPLNVAVTLGRLGTPVSILTAIGDDDRGAALRDHLAGSHVDIRQGPVLPRTSSAVARVGVEGAATYEFDISWPAVDPPDLSDVGILHTGSIAFFCRPGAAAVGELLRTAHDSGVVTTLDPNVRPALVGDRDTAVRNLEATLPSVDVLKLSDEDASWLYPGLGHDAVVALLLERGPRLVALTRGSAGSSLVTPITRVDVPAPPTTVVDTVGAGDAWMGALVHGLFADPEPGRLLDRLDDSILRELGVRASRVAAATVATQGASPPWADELDPTSPVPTAPHPTVV